MSGSRCDGRILLANLVVAQTMLTIAADTRPYASSTSKKAIIANVLQQL
jgi:hypothetical protein